MQDAGEYLISEKLTSISSITNDENIYTSDQFLLPITSESIVLNVCGKKDGGSLALAQYVKMIYALNQTWESLRILKQRSNLKSADNIFPIEANIYHLPFSDNYFDFIVLDSQTIHYKSLRELYRVMKPGGSIYITMKNRIGWRYFYKKLHSLITQTGFVLNHSYAAYFENEKIAQLVPFDLIRKINLAIKNDKESVGMTFSSLRKWLPSGIAILASKDKAILPQCLMQVLINQKLISAAQQSQYQLVLMNNHFGSDAMINYLVYDKIRQQTIYFCRISYKKLDDALIMQSTQLSRINDRLKTSELANTIPTILFYGFIDGVTIQITSYLSAKPAFSPPWKKLPVIHNMTNSVWLQRSAPKMSAAIHWLVQFQRQTLITRVNIGDVMDGWLTQKASAMARNGIQVEASFEALREALCAYHAKTVPLVIQHGAFNLENILHLSKTKKIFIDHFQSIQVNALPFFDFGSLIFNPLLAEWKLSGENLSLSDYASTTGWSMHIQQWIAYYSDQLALDSGLMQWLPQLVAIEQQAKLHPLNQNIYDYPMYGQESFRAMMAFKI